MDWSEILRKIIALAGPSATITFTELESLLPSTVEPEDIESLFAALREADINIEND